MKFIIICQKADSDQNIIFLNLITQNIKKIYKKAALIEIIDFGHNVKDCLFIDTNDYMKILYPNNILNIFSYINYLNNTKEERYIINIYDSFSSKIFAKLLFKRPKKYFSFFIEELNDKSYDYHIQEMINFISSIFFKKHTLINTPKIIYQNNNLKKTKKLINWNLNSSGNNKIEKLKYIFIYLRLSSIMLYKTDLLRLLTLAERKVNLKVVFIFDELNMSEVQEFFSELKTKTRAVIIDNYFWNDDKHYIMNFCNHAKLTITNDPLLNTYNNVKKNPSVIIDEEIKINKKNKSISKIKEMLLFKKVKKTNTKFSESLDYLIQNV